MTAKLSLPALWESLQQYPMSNGDAHLSFVARLAREQRWTAAFAARAVFEYKRFCYLCVLRSGKVTPSYWVDQVWHLHLTYTQDYWLKFCPQILGMQLHHQPTEAGPADDARFREQYAQTLQLYETEFGEPAPDFWPDLATQFRDAPMLRMVNVRQYYLVRKPNLWRWLSHALVPGLVLTSLSGGARAQGVAALLNPFDLAGPQFLVLFLIGIFVSIIISKIVRALLLSGGKFPRRALTAIELATLIGGRERAVNTAEVELVQQDRLYAGADGVLKVGVQKLGGDAHGLDGMQLVAMLRAQKSGAERYHAKRALANLEQTLIADGFMLAKPERQRIALLSAIPQVALLLLGLSKIAVGLSRDKPVLFLALLCIVLTVMMLLRLFAMPRPSNAGLAAIKAMRRASLRLEKSPTQAEWAKAFALFGYGALLGTSLSAFAQQRQASASSSDSGASSSARSDGGRGGSGCGGCGGGD